MRASRSGCTPRPGAEPAAAARAMLPLSIPSNEDQKPRRGNRKGRVGPAPLSAGPPSEPDVRLSPHPAQACPPRRLARRPTIRSMRRGSSAGPFIAAVAATSNLSIGSGFIVSFSWWAHLTTSALFRARARGPVSGQLCATIGWKGPTVLPRFPVAFRLPALASGHPVPAEELGSPYGRLTGSPEGGPDLDGVSVFHTHELRSGWVPSLLRGRRCSS